MRRFFFHYNKPASKKAGSPKLTVHYKGECQLVDHVNCYCNVETKHNKRQPYCVIQGKCGEIVIKRENNQTIAEIYKA